MGRGLVLVVLLLAGACADRRDKAACEQVVDHIVKITHSQVPREDLVTRCINDLSREELACATAAKSEADLKNCAGW